MSRHVPKHAATRHHPRFLPPGWWCSLAWPHTGPCTLRPHWWNLAEFARRYRRSLAR